MANLTILIGNLGDDVKMHHFEGGGCIGRFPLATTKSWKDKSSGEKKSKTVWHNIVVRNKTAELCDKYLSKGKKVYIEGEIDSRNYQAEAGHTVYVTEIVARTVEFLTPLSEGSGSGSNNPAAPQEASRPEHAGDQFLNGGNNNNTPEDDDLPF